MSERAQFQSLSYAAARQAARALLGDKAELQELKKTPVYRYIVGMRVRGKFVPMGAGGTWAEAIEDLRKQRGGMC